MKKICFFGIYDREYPRNKVIIKGFTENNYTVVHCNVNPRLKKGFGKYWLLLKEWRKIYKQHFDLVWVAFPGHTCVWLARILFLHNTLIFDVFLSLYEANVSDRKVHKPGSPDALKDRFLDWYSIRCSDVVTLDTNEQINLFERKYGLKKKKTIRIFLSSALSIAEHKENEQKNKFIVHFHGSFIPLHGVQYIIEAAKILEKEENIVFNLVGGGQQYQEMKDLAKSYSLKNVEFVGRLPEYNDVLKYLEVCNVMLGMFAPGGRGHYIIPNKIFEGMVFGKAMITADTLAIHELLTDKENVLLCKPGDPSDLAEKIKVLYVNDDVRKKIGMNAQEYFRNNLLPKKLINDLLIKLQLIK